MEFCPHCQKMKPFYVQEYSGQIIKKCRDCQMMIGYIAIPEINILINELNFYKGMFYKTEIESCQKNSE